MPLFQSKSKKAFKHNLETEMAAGKPQKQALAISYNIKRKPRPKKAFGGEVTAKTEKRPMPDDLHNDSDEARRNKGNKPPSEDSWTDQPTVKQAQKNNGREVLPIKRPKMVPTNAFSTKLYDEEGKLQESASPGPYGAQPPKSDDEEDAKKMGKDPDMADEHSTHRKPYAKGGEIEASDEHHPMDGKYEDDLLDLGPSEDEGHSMAMSDNEEGPDRHGDDVPDMEREHSNGEEPYDLREAAAYADGGEVSDEDELEHAASIAAAIMTKLKMRREDGMSGSTDEGEAMEANGAHGRRTYARGGPIKSADSLDTTYNDQADLSRNADEDSNLEDQASFRSLARENYSETPGLNQLDSPEDSAQHGDAREYGEENIHDSDIVSAIRRKLKIKSAITR